VWNRRREGIVVKTTANAGGDLSPAQHGGPHCMSPPEYDPNTSRYGLVAVSTAMPVGASEVRVHGRVPAPLPAQTPRHLSVQRWPVPAL